MATMTQETKEDFVNVGWGNDYENSVGTHQRQHRTQQDIKMEQEKKEMLERDSKKTKKSDIPVYQFSSQTWDCFNKIVCITNAQQPKIGTTSFLKKIDMIQSVEFVFNENKTPHDLLSATRSMFETCISVMREALLDRSLKNLFLFKEDIALLSSPSKQQELDMKHFVSVQHFDVFMLGADPNIFFNRSQKVSSFKHVFKLNADYSSGYVLSRRFMERIVNLEFETFRVPIEKVFALNDESYALLLPFFCPLYENKEMTMLARIPIALKSSFAATSQTPLVVYSVCAAVLIVLLLLLLFLR